jgi:indolepyruvate decarboxylase
MYTIGQYLLNRLSEIGIRDIFGVPGDYNLSFLDYVEDNPNLNWIGNSNELNAAYAADGYARMNGVAAMITTFGVGELSALNGIAGSFAEQVPVIQITGAPTIHIQENGLYMHHTLGLGNFENSKNAYKQFTIAQASLTEENAASEIDRVIKEVMTHKRPGYISLPIDIANKPIITKSSKPLSLELDYNESDVKKVSDRVLELLNNSKNPVIFAGNDLIRYNIQDKFTEWTKKANLPVTTFLYGKSAFDETNINFIGTYYPNLSDKKTLDRIDNSDLVIIFGTKIIDSSTGGFAQKFSDNVTFVINSDEIKLPNGSHLNNIPLDNLLDNLIASDYYHDEKIGSIKNNDKFIPKEEANLTQDRYLTALGQFIKPNDVLFTEQGTSSFGTTLLPLKKNVSYISQTLWGSIGYSLPAILGSQIADPKRRHILLIGDGAFQLTAQELGLAVRENLKPIIFLVDNNGYTVERVIHGEKATYNDIAKWNYLSLPKAFGGNETNMGTYFVKTEKDLENTLDVINQESNKAHFVVVKLQEMDAPVLLRKVASSFAKQNS